MIAGPEANGWEGQHPPGRGGRGLAARGGDPALRTVVRGRVSGCGVQHEWEPALGSGSPLYVDADLVVAADASLYYRENLIHRLSAQGVEPRDSSSAALIAAAYRAFGPGCVDVLEGDYAFAIWHPDKRTLFAARDPFGMRSLYHWEGPIRSGSGIGS
jgi:asparagine synthetase B (glutamine-hydrolysing)